MILGIQRSLAVSLMTLGISTGHVAAQDAPPAPQNEATEEAAAASKVPDGQELVSIDFPEPTEIKDIIRAVALWTGKNVILGKGVNGKVQMISPRKVTKEEAYQAFLSALNVLNLTTVETGKVIKIMPTRNALKDNLRIYQGTSWAPRTDKLITQIVPLRYIDAKQIQTTLSRIVSTNSMIAYEATNTLIISDTGYKVRRILQIVELLDVAGQQPQVVLVPIRYGDAKSIASKVSDILKASSGRSSRRRRSSKSRRRSSSADYRTYKVSVDERSNSVVIFGPPRTIEDVKDLVKKFDFPVEDPANQAAIRVRFLDYADAKKLATTLSSLAQGGNSRATSRRRTIGTRRTRSSSRRSTKNTNTPPPVADLGDNVKITADESSNALLITGSRSAYEAINNIIRKLDRRRAQVYVEADILDVNLSNEINFGTSIIAGSGNGNSIQTYGWQGEGIAPLTAVGNESSESLSDAQKLQIASALGRDFTIGVLSGSVNVPGIGEIRPGALITMLKADGNTRVLSSPHLLTSNNEEASIVVGETLFFKSAQTSAAIGAGAVEKVEKEDADLNVTMKPNISHSGNYVTMKLDIEANEGSIDPSSSLPNINKRKSSQLVTVRNGQTAVISGLVKRREQERYQKIPLLGDIPILGWLFRNSTIAKSTTSLMIFITPYVVYGANDLAAIYRKKVEERDEMMLAAFGDDPEDKFYKSMPDEDDGEYKPNAIDQYEDEQQRRIMDEMRREMGYKSGSATGAAGLLPGGDEDEGDDPTTVPMLDGGFEGYEGDSEGGFTEPPPPLDDGGDDLGDAPPPIDDGGDFGGGDGGDGGGDIGGDVGGGE